MESWRYSISNTYIVIATLLTQQAVDAGNFSCSLFRKGIGGMLSGKRMDKTFETDGLLTMRNGWETIKMLKHPTRPAQARKARQFPQVIGQ